MGEQLVKADGTDTQTVQSGRSYNGQAKWSNKYDELNAGRLYEQANDPSKPMIRNRRQEKNDSKAL